MITIITFLTGSWLVYYGGRLSIGRYESQDAVPREERWIYWGAIPVMVVGVYLITTSLLL